MNKYTRSVSLIDGHTEEITDADIIKALECCANWESDKSQNNKAIKENYKRSERRV